MAGRRMVKADYPALQVLWTQALPAVRALWPHPVDDLAPDFDEFSVFGSTDAQGLRFAIMTRPNVLDLTVPSTKGLPGDKLVLGEQAFNWVGPRPGLSASLMLAAYDEVCAVWAADARARGVPGTYCSYGIVPRVWNAAFMSMLTNAGNHTLNIVDGEWPVQGNWSIIWRPMSEWYARFP